VDYGSEFRYRDRNTDPETLVLAIAQSGETVDTLAAMEEAREKGARMVSIVNVIGSMAQRANDGVILMHAGPETGLHQGIQRLVGGPAFAGGLPGPGPGHAAGRRESGTGPSSGGVTCLGLS
jgi:hypothetical protein